MFETPTADKHARDTDEESRTADGMARMGV